MYNIQAFKNTDFDRLKTYVSSMLKSNGCLNKIKHNQLVSQNHREAIFFQKTLDEINIEHIQLIAFLTQDRKVWPTCKTCGKEFEKGILWYTKGPFKHTWKRYCDSKCANKDQEQQKRIHETKCQNIGDNYTKIIQRNIEKSFEDKYGEGIRNAGQIPGHSEKVKKTKKEKFDDENFNNIKKTKITNLKKYGHSCNLHSSEGKQKCKETRKKNGNISKDELYILEKLSEKFPSFDSKIHHQYMDIRYKNPNKNVPWDCDFYIPELDLFIEFQGYVTHGLKKYRVPYDENNKEHLEMVKMLKESPKYDSFYKAVIKIWTKSDPLKRKVAKENGLNWIEFFDRKQFNEWYENH